MSVNYVDKTTGDLIHVAGGGKDVLYADSPIGSIIPFGGTTAPSGFLLCQGQAVSRTTYAELFAVIGTSFGSGDGSTTFNVPDLRGEFIRGAGTNSHTNQGNGGAVGEHQDATAVPVVSARYNGSKVIAEITSPADETGSTRSNVLNPDSQFFKRSESVYGSYSAEAEPTSGYQEFSVRPTNTSVNYIIKATQVGVPADFAPVDMIENENMKAVTSNAVYSAIRSIIKVKMITMNTSDFSIHMDLTSRVSLDSGYSFLCWVNASMSGTGSNQNPITFREPLSIAGKPKVYSLTGISSGENIQFVFLEVLS